MAGLPRVGSSQQEIAPAKQQPLSPSRPSRPQSAGSVRGGCYEP